ncbi:magnesium-translocating P-type ATPase [compost metagenome]
MVVSVTLARGAIRLARKHVIVKRLPVIQNLGTMDVFCTDKTGTLTEARIRLDRTVDVEGRRTYMNVFKYIMLGTSSNFGNMFSMAGAALFLPFLPMLPVQILLNNMLYDLPELPIPLDNVDAEDISSPRRLDIGLIRQFMFVIGPVSSAFDFITFYLLLHVLKATEAEFQICWFVESLCTQVLVIFVIRTRHNPLRSRPQGALAAACFLVVAAALWLPLGPLAGSFSSVSPPPLFYLMLAPLVVCYLAAVHEIKRRFFLARFARRE